ncbi:MAG: PAS domain S-box protein, partial [Candidatus Thorarchaeota archaeon]
GNINLLNQKGLSLLDYKEEEIMGKNWFDFVVPDKEKERTQDVFNRIMKGEVNLADSFENVVVTRNGDERLILWNNKYIRDKDGVIRGTFSSGQDITEMRSAENALRESEEKYRSLVEQSLVGFSIISGDPVDIPFANEPLAKITGYSVDEIIGMETESIASLVHKDDLENLRQLIYDCRRKGERQGERMQVRLVRKNGDTAWVELTVNRIEYMGKPAVQIAFVDISEKRRAEEELGESEQELKMIYNTIREGIIFTDENMNIISCNPGAERMLGYSSDELKSRSYYQIIDESMALEPDQKTREKRLSEDGYLEQEDFYFKRKNGEIFPCSFSVTLVKDDSGKFKGLLGSFRDTTESKRINEELRSEKEKYQVLFDAAPVAIAVSRENGEILDVNKSLEEMLGYPLEVLKQKSATEFYTKAEDRTRIGNLLTLEGKVRDAQVKMITKDRVRIDVLQNVDYINYESDIARLSTMRDITELNKTKEALEEARARAEFFNDLMAHDINNVHQGILVGAELLLRRSDLSKDAERHTRAIRDQVSRGIQLIENVRKLSKMQTDEVQILQPLDLHTVLANAILLVQHGFPEKEVRINISINPEEVIVLADEFLIDLVYNLVHNAMKFTREDGIIEILVEPSKHEGFVRVAVSDKGPGISDDRKDDVFSRLEKGRTLGSGMGLTLVKRIAGRYGGNVWVEDRVPGSYTMGAKFIVELPIHKIES